jgi:hypothetical protein
LINSNETPTNDSAKRWYEPVCQVLILADAASEDSDMLQRETVKKARATR